MFKLNDEANLLYTQYCFNMLPINYMLDLQKLSLLNMQCEHFLPIVRSLYAVSGCSRFNELRIESMVLLICVVAYKFRKRVWDVFISSVAFWTFVYISIYF